VKLVPETVHAGACPLDCPDTCAWQVTVRDGRAVKLRGDKDHPFTRGGLCGKVNRFIDAVYAPDRLLEPLVRVGPKGDRASFRAATWDEAVAVAAAGLRDAIERHGPQSVLPYHYAGTMGLIQGWSLGNRLFAHMGASRLGYTICTGAATAALGSIHGGKVGVDAEAIRHAQLIIVWGANTMAANVHQWVFIQEAKANGAYIVGIDPLRTDTMDRCDEHLALLPGTDAALALGLMRLLVDADAVDREWLAAHTDGWSDLEAELANWPIERTAEITRLDASVIAALANRIATTRPTAIRVGLGLQRHAGAGQAIRSIMAIPLVTGDYRYVGGGALCSAIDHHRMGAARVGEAPRDLPTTTARTINMSRLSEALEAPLEPPIHALVVYSANPMATNPDQERLRRGMRRPDLFTVVIEQRWTDTCDEADVIFPATMQFEHLDVFRAYGHHYATLNRPAIAPLGEAKPTTEVFRRLATALGFDHPRLHDTDEEILRQLVDAAGIDSELLEKQGWVRATGVEPDTAPYANGGFPTPSGRARLVDAALGEHAGIRYVPPAEVGDEQLEKRYPLALLSPAARYFLNSTFGSIDWHRARQGEPKVHLHPTDAARRSLVDGDAVRVHNDRGAFDCVVTIDERARPGVAFTFKAYWPRLTGGASVNATTAVRDSDIGGSPCFHDNRVEVVKRG
jgi:anaerobic selenocysteine-containing dehydrogenase